MMASHIEREDASEESLVYTMLCGEQCVVFDNGTVVPPGFDFYLFEHGDRATCPHCRLEHAVRRVGADAQAKSSIDTELAR
jgi:hypothetical protein